jgi:hypothetical protein
MINYNMISKHFYKFLRCLATQLLTRFLSLCNFARN